MTYRKTVLVLFIGLFLSLGLPKPVLGFGVSPPWVKSNHLLRGSHYEQTINLIRENPKQEYPAQVKFSSEASEIRDWITLNKGMEFTIPAGVQKFPLKVTVDVPQDAELGKYEGYIWISGKSEEEGQVTTVTGGTVELELEVTDQEFSDWRLRDWGINDVKKNEDSVKVYFDFENLGNVEARPSKVHLDVYDSWHRKMLESEEDTNLEFVAPFESKRITATFPIDLPPKTQYWGEVKVYKGEEVFLSDKARFDVGKIPVAEEKTEEGKESSKKGNNFLLLAGVLIAAGVGFGLRKFKKVKKEKKERK